MVFTLLRDGDFAIKLIIGINIFFYILSLIISNGISFSANPLNFLSPDTRALIFMGASGKIPVESYNFWWSFVSASYLHGSILHIGFNMLAFSQLYKYTLSFYGNTRSFIIYSISGISGFVLSYISGTSVTIGASAAICGLIGALFYYGKSRGGLHGSIVYKQVSGWIISLVIFGLLIPGIDNFGHLGGFLGGLVSGFLLGYIENRKNNIFNTVLAFFLIVLTAGVLLMSAINCINIIF
jgi:rhomboid protease GluP